MRHFVVPGDKILDRQMRIENAYVEAGATHSAVLGFYDDERNSIIPLEGAWKPRIGDLVIGIVSSIGRNGGTYNIDLTEFISGLVVAGKFSALDFKEGDIIEATIQDIEHKNLALLERPKALKKATMIKIKPVKIARVIGRAETMIKQISEYTGCSMVVGKNGLIWLDGGNVALATDVILKIEREEHLSGLTERIKDMLEKESKR